MRLGISLAINAIRKVTAGGVPANAILAEDGSAILAEDGSYILQEG